MELAEEDPEIFDIAHAWLYTTKLTQSKDGEDIGCWPGQLGDLFNLADRLGMPSLCNNAIDDLRSCFWKSRSVPSSNIITNAYANTLENSVLRKLFVGMMTCNHER